MKDGEVMEWGLGTQMNKEASPLYENRNENEETWKIKNMGNMENTGKHENMEK